MFEFQYSIDGQCPKLTLLRDIAVTFSVPPLAKDRGKVEGRAKNEGKEVVVKNGGKMEDVTKGTSAKADTNHQILASAMSEDGVLFAVATTSKQCLVYNVADQWSQVRLPVQLPKAPTAALIDFRNKYVILSDRAGNVRRYDINEGSWANSRNNNETDEVDEGCEGELLLGHVSMVLDIAFGENGRFLISADRDEKIRISRYPQCYVIHRFCLGHLSYVNSIHTKDRFLFSSGGDGTLRVWDVSDGNQIAQYDCYEKKPVRCFSIFPNSTSKVMKFAMIFEECKTMQIIAFTSETSNFEAEYMNCSDCLIDVAVEDNGVYVFALTRSSIVCGKVGEGQLEAVSDVGDNVLESLLAITDPLPFLEKKVGFNNVEEYRQRKNERIRTKRRKLSVGSV